MTKQTKIDLDFFPKSLLSESSKVLGDEFNKLPNRIQTGYVNTFWTHNGIIKHNQHNRDPESFVMGNDEVNKNFTNYKNFNAVNNNGYYLRPQRSRHGVIEGKYVLELKETKDSIYYDKTGWLKKTVNAFQGWKQKGITGSKNGYKLSPKINNLLDSWHIKTKDELGGDLGFVNGGGETPKELEGRLGGAIYRNLSEVDSAINVNLEVAISQSPLVTHRKYLEVLKEQLEIKNLDKVKKTDKAWKEVVETLRERQGTRARAEGTIGGVNIDLPLQTLLSKDLKLSSVKQRLVEINRLLVTARENSSSSIPVFYTEAITGRYTAKALVLQGYHKSVRYAALSGCYEYDLEAAHQNILIQLLDREGKSFPELDVLREYVANKQGVRVRLSEELNIHIDTVKEIIQELTYGAKLTKFRKVAIYKTCGGDKELLERVVNNKWLQSLESVFKLAHKYLIEDRGNIVNAVGIAFDTNNRGASPELAHILQGYERRILDAIIKHSNKNDIALLVHDCVVFYNRQNTDELSAIVKEETGFDLEFSEERY